MSGRIFNLTGDNVKPTLFSSQPVPSNIYPSQPQLSNNISSQPTPDTFARTNTDPQFGSPNFAKRRLTLDEDHTNQEQFSIRDSKMRDYDVYMSKEDQVKENLQSLMISKDIRYNGRYSSGYNNNSDNDNIKSLLNTVATLTEELKRYKEKSAKLEEQIIQDNIRYEEFKMELSKELRQRDEERYQNFLKMENACKNELDKAISMDYINKQPIERSELKTIMNINKLMGYLTSVTVIDQIESLEGISFDCEISCKSNNRSLKFKLYVPNDDTKAVDYIPDNTQLNEITMTALPNFLKDSITFEKPFLPIFFWRLSSSIQGKPNTN